MWFIGAEVEQETRAPPPKKNPGSAPGLLCYFEIQIQGSVIDSLCKGQGRVF